MRYVILVLLNAPFILLALLNIVTQFKLKKITKRRFGNQLVLWLFIFIALIASFPIYNLSMGRPLLDSTELSLFDIVQTTAIVFMIYTLNRQRQKIEITEKTIRDLHQEISIKLSK